MKIFTIFMILLIIITCLTYQYSKKTGSVPAGVFNLFLGSVVLYNIAPPVLAFIEHMIDNEITYGNCRVYNFPPEGTGKIVVGAAVEVTNDNKIIKMDHLRSYIENKQYDMTCPLCFFTDDIFLIMDINKFTVKNVYVNYHPLIEAVACDKQAIVDYPQPWERLTFHRATLDWS